MLAVAAISMNAQTAATFNFFDPADCDADGWLWLDTPEKIAKYVGPDKKLKLVNAPYEIEDPEFPGEMVYPESTTDPYIKGYNNKGEQGGEGSKTGAIILPAAEEHHAFWGDHGGAILVNMPDCATFDVYLSQELPDTYTWLEVLGITEFGMMGILEDVAHSLGISVVKAGHFITAYSAGVAVGAPLLVLLRKWPLKKLLLLLVSVILIGNVCTAASPGYLSMLVSRFISGLPHGAFFGAAAIVAERISSEGRKAESVAIVLGGMTVANMVGVPLATFLSNTIDWRVAFIVVALCALIGLIAIKSYLPALPALPDTGIKGQFHFLTNPGPWLVYAGVFFGQASVYCWLSYIAPMMTQVTHFSQSAMTWIMVVVGFGPHCHP